MAKKTSLPEAQNPLIINCHRLMEAFAKANDERDFYLDKVEGFILYINLDKEEEEIEALEKELKKCPERYCHIPKFTYFETKKFMESFIHEKVYDIDTKEKLAEIIQSKDSRENFLEFLFDQHTEFEKWQQFYQERSRVRIIEWLRQNQFHFVFEEDLDITKSLLEKIKRSLFEAKAGKDVLSARKALSAKAKTYYSNEALNPRPKRGRPPKQQTKLEIEPQFTVDIYTTVPSSARPFLFTPDVSSPTAMTFSSKFDTEEGIAMAKQNGASQNESDLALSNLNEKLATLRSLSTGWTKDEEDEEEISYPDSITGHEEEILKKFAGEETPIPKIKKKTPIQKKEPAKKKRSIIKKPVEKKAKKPVKPKKVAPRRIIKKAEPAKKKKP
jgi:hypothetical protein